VSLRERWRRLVEEIDLHVMVIVAALVGLGPLIAFHAALFGLSPRLWLWSLPLLLLIPQGRILTRALGDYPTFGEPSGPYLLANEGVVLAGCALHLLLGSLVA
jgi:hypothetical protein